MSYLDWPFFDDSHRALAEGLEAWCVAELDHHEPDDVDAACRELVRKLADGGWLRFAVPSAFGGAREALDVRSLAIIRETLGRHSGLADFVFAMQGLGSGTISLFGTPEQQAAYLPAVAAGEKIAAFALTEPDSGSDVAAIATSAEEQADGSYLLNGAKTYISNGGIADYYVVFARTGEAPGARGLSAFIVDADAPGLEIAERIRVIAPHPLARIVFNNVRLPAGALLGERGKGFGHAMATLDIFRTTVGAAAMGFAKRALEEATRRALTRKHGAGTLSDNAVVQAQLAEMILDIETASLLIYRAAWLRDVAGKRNTKEAALAKLHATEGAQRVIDQAVQIFGGEGVTHGSVVEALYREVRALRIYEGASEVQRLVIARQHLANP
nr:acyl-CoA dehydrogenase family protein [Sphingobium boeckii]